MLVDKWRRLKVKLTSGGFWSEFAGGASLTGESVTHDRVLQVGAAYACAKKIAEGISCLPFIMQTIEASGASRADPSHPLAKVLGDQPNADQPAQQFWELVVLQLTLRGNHYSLKINFGGKLIGLEPLPGYPETYCRRNANGAREFVVTTGRRRGTYAESEIFFIPGFGENLDCGLSVVTLARHTFGRILSLEKHQSKLLANGVRPNVIMTTPGVLTPEQRTQIRENIIDPYVGSDNAGGVMLLEAGFEMKPVTLSPADAQLLEQQNIGVEEVCRWFGVPPWLIGHSGTASNWGTGLAEQFRGYGTLTLQPITKRIMGEVRRQLMTPAERLKFKPVMSLAALYEGDTKTATENDERDVRSGIRTPNEVRATRGLAPVEGGDVLRMQQQMIPLVIDPNQGGSNAA